MANTLVLVLGAWLMVTAFLWERGTIGGVDAAWNDFAAGTAIAVLAVLRILGPSRTGFLAVITVLLGLWLIAAPFVLGYEGGAEAAAATWNNCVVGVFVTITAVFSLPARNRDALTR